MEPIDFLSLIWGDQKGYVFLPQKAQRWAEGPAFNWPEDRAKVEDRLDKGTETDQYYCPNLFSQPVRQRQYVQKPRWLYADLDNTSPHKIDLRPQIAIQSSPGRFQALWRLSRSLDPVKHESYNRRLSYATGADRGGWDLTQVLRIPGTRNHKYPGRVLVKGLWFESGKTSLAEANHFLGGVEANLESLEGIGPDDLLLPAESSTQIRKRIWSSIDQRSRALLEAKDERLVGAEGRSGVLWEIECRLLEYGLPPEEVFVVVRDTIWNKFDDRNDGDEQLWREVQKAVLHVGRIITPGQGVASSNGGLTRARPRLYTYADVLSSAIREPEWAIDGYWTLASHGIIAGLPKSFKSLLVFDMAVSLASETDFLGQFGVNPKAVGPVLVVQQENSVPLVRDRLLKISHSRGLQTGTSSVESGNIITFRSPPAIPLIFYNDFGFDMTMLDDQEAVETVIRQEGIKTIIFDPLYLMIGGANENVAQEMRPILQWLLRIRNRYNTAVLVVHHWGKEPKNRGGRGLGGTRLIGSTTIYAWLEAALYLESKDQGDGRIQVIVEREFRERPPAPPMAFDLTLGDVGELDYSWTTGGSVGSTNKLLEGIGQAGPRGATLIGLRKATQWGQKKLRKEIDELIDRGLVEEAMDGRIKRFFLTGREEASEE